jgi:hypothetical protein
VNQAHHFQRGLLNEGRSGSVWSGHVLVAGFLCLLQEPASLDMRDAIREALDNQRDAGPRWVGLR